MPLNLTRDLKNSKKSIYTLHNIGQNSSSLYTTFLNWKSWPLPIEFTDELYPESNKRVLSMPDCQRLTNSRDNEGAFQSWV